MLRVMGWSLLKSFLALIIIWPPIGRRCPTWYSQLGNGIQGATTSFQTTWVLGKIIEDTVA